MTKKEAVDFYVTQIALAKALDITQSTVAGWGDYPPDIRQVQLEMITGGKLKAEPECFGAAVTVRPIRLATAS